MAKKKTLAIFSATGCRACENAILDIHYRVNSLTRWADIHFWPYLLGSELQELEDLDPVDVCLFAGAIRTAGDIQAARSLRSRSRVLIACGSCAAYGGIPGLMDLPATAPPSDPPSTQPVADGFSPGLPQIEKRVRALPQIVDVDYTVPGCAPRRNYLWAAIQSIIYETEASTRLSFAAGRLPQPIAQAISSGVMPPKGSIFSGQRAVCASCSRAKEQKQFKNYTRTGCGPVDAKRCLLEQGFVCQGVVTREGCGGLCTAAGLPCRGCFGKTDAILDPGAKMVSAVSSTFDSSDPDELAALADQFVDLAGTFYRYTLAGQCVLKGVKV